MPVAMVSIPSQRTSDVYDVVTRFVGVTLKCGYLRLRLSNLALFTRLHYPEAVT
jgi:hypothetical protein